MLKAYSSEIFQMGFELMSVLQSWARGIASASARWVRVVASPFCQNPAGSLSRRPAGSAIRRDANCAQGFTALIMQKRCGNNHVSLSLSGRARGPARLQAAALFTPKESVGRVAPSRPSRPSAGRGYRSYAVTARRARPGLAAPSSPHARRPGLAGPLAGLLLPAAPFSPVPCRRRRLSRSARIDRARSAGRL